MNLDVYKLCIIWPFHDNDRNQYFEILAECNEEVIKDNSYQDNFEGEEDIDIEMETAMPRDVKGSAGGIAER